jgi:hypothetical protein
MPARVGFDSVRSIKARPDARARSTAIVNGFAVLSHEVRAENMEVILPFALRRKVG